MTSTTTPRATGYRELRDGQPFVAFTRTFPAAIDDVWAAVTESDRLARWIGSWTGDPDEGHVMFRMLFEGDEHPAERMEIEECRAPEHLALRSISAGVDGEQVWEMRLDLAEADGVTTLVFAQSVPDPGEAEGVGPGWDYYLDRMVAAETGGDPATIEFDDYYPALVEHYRGEFA